MHLRINLVSWDRDLVSLPLVTKSICLIKNITRDPRLSYGGDDCGVRAICPNESPMAYLIFKEIARCILKSSSNEPYSNVRIWAGAALSILNDVKVWQRIKYRGSDEIEIEFAPLFWIRSNGRLYPAALVE